MLEKDKTKIQEELLKFVENDLTNKFKDSKGRPVEKIENITIVNIEYDNKNEIRNRIILTEFIADTRLFMRWVDGSSSSLNTQFRNNIPMEFEIDFETEEITLIESDLKLLPEKLF